MDGHAIDIRVRREQKQSGGRHWRDPMIDDAGVCEQVPLSGLENMAGGDNPETHFLAEHLYEALNRTLDELSEHERRVLCLRFGMRCSRQFTYEEISQRLGISQLKARYVFFTGMRRLKKGLASSKISEVVDKTMLTDAVLAAV